ncbi:hypothetical protein Peur_034915 [Populus x canadensis]
MGQNWLRSKLSLCICHLKNRTRFVKRQNCHAGGCEFVTDKHTDMPICSRKVVYIAMKTPALRGGYYDFVDGCFKLREVKPHLASPIIL